MRATGYTARSGYRIRSDYQRALVRGFVEHGKNRRIPARQVRQEAERGQAGLWIAISRMRQASPQAYCNCQPSGTVASLTTIGMPSRIMQSDAFRFCSLTPDSL
jgi:type 1 glutamine amidotransferase